FFSSRRRHTRFSRDWSSDVCSSDLPHEASRKGIQRKGAKLGISLPQDITNEEAYLFRRLLDGPLKGAKVKMHGRTAIPAPAGEKIGRASCRERGEVTGVGGGGERQQ